jgi:hypothetical protein
MRRVNLWLAAGVAVVVALAAAACARDASAPGASIAEPGAPAVALSDGAFVRATVREAIEVPGAGTAPEVRELGLVAREAVVAGGEAMDRESGTLLAVAEGRLTGERESRYADGEGHQHRLVVAGLGGRGPIASVRYERDGEVVAVVTYRWEPRGGGFALRERVLELHRGGRVLIRHVRAAGLLDVRPGTEAVVPSIGQNGGPLPPVALAQAIPCLREWATYIGASATLIVAGEIFTVAPNPATASALVAAASAWETSLDALLTCQVRSAFPL